MAKTPGVIQVNMLRIELNLHPELMFGGLENIREMIAIFAFGFLMVHINTKHNIIFFLTPYLRKLYFHELSHTL